jgi:hypothetical protein
MAKYTVKPGDNYFALAGKNYGNQRFAEALAAANDGQRLHPGMVIDIPDFDTRRQPRVSEGFMAGVLSRELEKGNITAESILADPGATPGVLERLFGPGGQAQRFAPGDMVDRPTSLISGERVSPAGDIDRRALQGLRGVQFEERAPQFGQVGTRFGDESILLEKQEVLETRRGIRPQAEVDVQGIQSLRGVSGEVELFGGVGATEGIAPEEIGALVGGLGVGGVGDVSADFTETATRARPGFGEREEAEGMSLAEEAINLQFNRDIENANLNQIADPINPNVQDVIRVENSIESFFAGVPPAILSKRDVNLMGFSVTQLVEAGYWQNPSGDWTYIGVGGTPLPDFGFVGSDTLSARGVSSSGNGFGNFSFISRGRTGGGRRSPTPGPSGNAFTLQSSKAVNWRGVGFA